MKTQDDIFENHPGVSLQKLIYFTHCMRPKQTLDPSWVQTTYHIFEGYLFFFFFFLPEEPDETLGFYQKQKLIPIQNEITQIHTYGKDPNCLLNETNFQQKGQKQTGSSPLN